MAILKLKITLPVQIIAFLLALLISGICAKASYSKMSDSVIFIDDIPVMESMIVEPEFSFSFDSPSGRIIILIITSNEEKKSIFEFYKELMPQLGWTISGSGYLKGKEKFQVVSSNNQEGIIWRLSITPVLPQ
tara:strand:- start:1153 stop:1551 length:399 start_codon:yes stop_codon:yes gene_type:complete